MMVFVNESIDSLLMQKHVPQGIEEVVDNEKDRKGNKCIHLDTLMQNILSFRSSTISKEVTMHLLSTYPCHLIGVPQEVHVPVDVHESGQDKGPVGDLVPEKIELVFLLWVKRKRKQQLSMLFLSVFVISTKARTGVNTSRWCPRTGRCLA